MVSFLNQFNPFKARQEQQQKQEVVLPDNTDLQPLHETTEAFNHNITAQKQELQKFSAEHSWLKKQPWKESATLPHQDTLYRVDGNAFIQSSYKLRDHSEDESHAFFIKFFENLLVHIDDPENADIKPYLEQIRHFQAALKTCKEIENRMRLTPANSIDQYAKELSDKFAKGELQWFPVTLDGEGAILHFDKDGSLSFIDPKRGIQETVMTTATDGSSKIKTKTQQFRTLANLNKKRYGSQEFFKYLLEIQLTKRSSITQEQMYEGLENYLEGKIASPHSPHREPHLYKTPPRGSKGSFKTTSTAFYYTLCGIFGPKPKDPAQAAKIFKKIKFLWQREALIHHCQNVGINRESLGFAEDIMQNMGREAVSLHQKGYLSDQDIRAMHATFYDLRSKIDAHKESVNEQRALPENLGEIDVESNRHEIVAEKDLHINHTSWYSSDVHSNEAQEVPPAVKQIHQLTAAIPPKMTDPTKAVNYLIECIHALEPVFLNNGSKEVVEAAHSLFEKILCQFPIPNRDSKKCFWSQVPQDQLMTSMQGIKQLMSLHYAVSRNSNFGGYNHTASDVAITYSFLAAIDKMARRMPEAQLGGQRTNYYQLLDQVKSPYFTIDNAQIQEKLQSVLEYFHPNFTIDKSHRLTQIEVAKLQSESLFGFMTPDYYGDYSSRTFGSQGRYKCPTETYYKKFIRWDVPAVAQQLQAVGITQRMPIGEQLKKILDNNIPILPEAGQCLLQATLFSTNLCLSEPRADLPSDRNRYPEFSYKCLVGNNIHIYLNNREIACEFIKPWGYEDIYKNLNYDYMQDTSSIMQHYRDGFEQEHHLQSQNNVVFQNKTVLDLTPELSAELQMIGCDPYDEANRAISFAHSHIPDLNKASVQYVIQNHLFNFGRLASQLEDAPEIVDRIIEFLDDAIKYHQKANDQETCLALIELGFKLQQYIESKGVKGKRSFPDFYSIVLNDLLPGSRYPLNCARILFKMQEKLSINGQPRDQEHLKRIAQAGVLNIVFTRRGNWMMDLATKANHLKWLPQIKELFTQDPKFLDQVFTKTLHLLTHKQVDDTWVSVSGHRYTNTEYTIDINTGDVLKQNEKLERMPDSILQSGIYQALNISPSSYFITKQDRYFTTYTIHPEEIEIEISKASGNSKVKKKFDGKTYYFWRNPPLLNQYPTIFSGVDQFWINEDRSHGMALKKGSDPIYLIKFPVKDPKPQPTNGWGFRETTPYKIVKNGKEFINFNAVNQELQQIVASFENDPAQIECWSKENSSELDTINLPRVGITLQIRKEGQHTRAYIQKYSGWFLSTQTPLQGVNEPYLILENSKGEKKTIILDKNGQSGPRWYEYTFEDQPGEGLKLSARDVESNLFLCSQAVGNPDKAYKILQNINPITALTSREMELVRKIEMNIARTGNHNFSAFLMQLYSFVEENNLKFPPNIGAARRPPACSLENFMPLYMHYKQNVGNAPSLALNDEQEKALLNLAKREYLKLSDDNKAPYSQFIKIVQTRLGDFVSRKSAYGAERIPALPKFRRFFMPLGYPELMQLHGSFYHYTPGRRIDPFDSQMILNNIQLLETDFCSLYDLAVSGSPEEKAKLKSQLDLLKPLTANSGLEKYRRTLLTVLKTKNPVNAWDLKEAVQAYKNIFFQQNPELYNKKSNACQKLFAKALSVSSISLLSPIAWYISNILQLLGWYLSSAFMAIADLKSKSRWKEAVNPAQAPSTLILLNGDALKQVDQGFGTFFQKTVEANFHYEDVPVEKIAPHLPTDHHNQLVKEKLRQENADLDNFDRLRPKMRRIYKVRQGVSLDPLQTRLDNEISRWESTLKTQAYGLVWMANQRVNDPNRLKIVRKESGNVKITWEDLKYCFNKGDMESFRRRTQLDDEQITAIFQQFADYSMKKSRLQQMKQARDAIEAYSAVCVEKQKLEKLLSEKEAAEKRSRLSKLFKTAPKIDLDPQVYEEVQTQEYLLLQQLVKTLQLFPPFDPKAENRSEMLLQVSNGYFYRDEQIRKNSEMLDKLKKDHEVLVELRTGFGKSKNTIPSVNLRLGQEKEKALIVNVWPSSHEKTNTEDLRDSLRQGAEMPVDALHFERSTDISIETLTKLLSELEKDRLEGRPLNIRPETFRSLECHLSLLLKQMDEGSVIGDEAKAILELLLKINRYSTTKTSALIDEARHNLNPKDKVIYTVDEPFTLPNLDMELIEDTFNILQEPPFKEALKIQNNKQAALTDEKYNELMELLATRLEAKFGITNETRKAYLDFVTGKIDEAPPFIKNHPRFEQIALLRGEILFLLKDSLHGYVGETFGISIKHRATKEFAIRYLSVGEPKENERAPSEFKNPHETLIKTYITYLYEGLSNEQTRKLVLMLQQQAFDQMGPRVPFKETPANKLFQTICPELADKLHAITENDLTERRLNEIRHNKNAIFYYIRYEIAKQIKLYPKTITSTTQNFRSQFAKSISLSATPQDHRAHGPRTTLIPSQGTGGEVTHVFYTKCHNQNRILMLQGKTPAELFDETLKLRQQHPTISGSVDTGGIFRGLSNHGIAQKTCENLRSTKAKIEAVVFFDNRENQQKFMSMDVATGNIKPFNEKDISPSKRITQYDQNRGIASDIHHPNNATGVVTLKPETTKSEAGQGWGRWRQGNQSHGTFKGQSPLFVLADSDRSKIFKEKDPEVTDLMVHMVANEAHAESEFNYHAIKDQMANEVRRALLDKMMGLPIDRQRGLYQVNDEINVDVDRALSLYARFKSEFVQKEEYSPSSLYLNKKSENTIDNLKRYQEQCIAKVKRFRGLTSAERTILINRLKEYSKKWEDQNQKLPLPEYVKGSSLGSSCEVYVDTKVEVHVDKHDQPPVLRTPSIWSDKTNLFKTGWESPSYRNRPLQFVVWLVSTVVQKIFNMINKGIKLSDTPISSFKYAIPILIGRSMFLPFKAMKEIYSKLEPTINKAWKSLSVSKCKTYQARDILRLSLGGQAIKLFTPQLLVTDNFYQQSCSGSVNSPIQIPLSNEQKPLFEVLVIQDTVRGKKQLKFLIIDQNDSQYFRKKLKQDQKSSDEAAKRSRKLAILDIRSNMIVAQSKNGFDDGEMASNEAFAALMTQVKMLAGEKDYSPEELSYLKKVTSKMSKEGRQQLLYGCLLRNHEFNLSRMGCPAGQILRAID